MDKARKKTDKLLKRTERGISDVYNTDPSLLRIQEKFDEYMKYVDRATRKLYLAYKNAPDGDERNRLKEEYCNEVKRLTLGSIQYKRIISEFTTIMAKVNQDALNVVNNEIDDVYVINYNQIADDCKKMGIKING